LLKDILDCGVIISFDKIFFDRLVLIAAPFVAELACIHEIIKFRATLIIVINSGSEFSFRIMISDNDSVFIT